MTLPEDVAVNDAGHAALHNETNTQVNVNTDAIATNTSAIADLVAAAGQLPTATTTQLTDIAHAINTDNKVAGKAVFNTTTGAIVAAVGATAGSVWNTAAGATAHTPA